MKVFSMLLTLMLWASSSLAGSLSEADIAQLKSEVAAMIESYEKGDPTLVLAKTHESMFAVVGGKEAFEKSTRTVFEQLQQAGMKIMSLRVGTPTQTYPAGEEEVCFVPRITVVEGGGKKGEDTTFMIAIRPIGGKAWKYLDGTVLRKLPDGLKILLPKLSKDVVLPPNTLEML